MKLEKNNQLLISQIQKLKATLDKGVNPNHDLHKIEERISAANNHL